MTLAGKCLCGAVRFTTEAAPLTVRSCWCRQCQSIATGGPTNNVFFRSEDVSIEGEVRWFDSVADSGAMLGRGFCPQCGTSVAVQSHVRRHIIAIRVGMFDDPDAVAPQSVIWTSAAPAWACIDPALPQEERQPPPLA